MNIDIDIRYTCIYVCVYIYIYIYMYIHTCLVAQSCLTLCYLIGSSPLSSPVHGIFQARILEWIAISCFRGSSQSRNRIHVSHVSCIGRQILYHSTTWEASINEICTYICISISPANVDIDHNTNSSILGSGLEGLLILFPYLMAEENFV